MRCAFCEVANGRAQVPLVYQDDRVVAFHDLKPRAPLHVLVIPRAQVTTLNDLEDAGVAGRLMMVARQLAGELGLAEDSCRLVLNCNRAPGQSVWHVHVHLLGGRRMSWSPSLQVRRLYRLLGPVRRRLRVGGHQRPDRLRAVAGCFAARRCWLRVRITGVSATLAEA